MRIKGVTLIELLAVIVMLAIILVIAVPTVSNIIRTSTMKSFESDAIRIKQIEDETLAPMDINETNINILLGC